MATAINSAVVIFGLLFSIGVGWGINKGYDYLGDNHSKPPIVVAGERIDKLVAGYEYKAYPAEETKETTTGYERIFFFRRTETSVKEFLKVTLYKGFKQNQKITYLGFQQESEEE